MPWIMFPLPCIRAKHWGSSGNQGVEKQPWSACWWGWRKRLAVMCSSGTKKYTDICLLWLEKICRWYFRIPMHLWIPAWAFSEFWKSRYGSMSGWVQRKRNRESSLCWSRWDYPETLWKNIPMNFQEDRDRGLPLPELWWRIRSFYCVTNQFLRWMFLFRHRY